MKSAGGYLWLKFKFQLMLTYFSYLKKKKFLVMAAILDRGLGCHTEF
jgi:hypothetical protein